MKKFSNVHKKQLFYWLGHHIDYPTPESKRIKLDDAARVKYTDALKAAIEHGLWAKSPRVPDYLGNKATKRSFVVTRPITCFTEWLVGESLPHTTRYGRLGLGFPRRFVFERGGHPLIYVKGVKTGDQYTKNLLSLMELLNDARLTRCLGEDDIRDYQRRLDYICHFAKWATPPPIPRVRVGKRRTLPKSRTPRTIRFTGLGEEVRFERSYGKRMDLLEEREWRIVYHPTFKKYFTKSPAGPNTPDYFIPFDAGEDLFTVVLPDNRTMNMVMNEKFFVKRFFPRDGLHTTILSLDDIGTF